MGKQIFTIEFKYALEPEGEWIAFSASVREPSSEGLWEVYDFTSETKLKFPVEKLILKKINNTWLHLDSDKESLMTALIGRSIDNFAAKQR